MLRLSEFGMGSRTLRLFPEWPTMDDEEEEIARLPFAA
jgi:hypothetical protein